MSHHFAAQLHQERAPGAKERSRFPIDPPDLRIRTEHPASEPAACARTTSRLCSSAAASVDLELLRRTGLLLSHVRRSRTRMKFHASHRFGPFG